MLIICPECGKEVSDKASHCIHCGYPLNNTNNQETNENEAILEEQKNTDIISSDSPNTDDSSLSYYEKLNTSESDTVYTAPNNKLPWKKILLALAVSVVVICVGIFIYYHSDGYYIKNVELLMENFDYDGAEELAQKISDETKRNEYISSINRLQESIRVSRVESAAENYFKQGLFSEATKAYQSISDSVDVSKKLDQISTYTLVTKYVWIIKDSLKNPSSLQINEVRVRNSDNDCIYIDYSGQNGFGGVSRSSVIINGTLVYEEGKSGYIDEKDRYFGKSSDYTSLNISIIKAGLDNVENS